MYKGRRQRDVVQMLLDKGVISTEQLAAARKESKTSGLNIFMSLERLGVIRNEEIVKIQADALGVVYLDLNDYAVDESLISLIPQDIAHKYKVLPLFMIDKKLYIGMEDPLNVVAIDHIKDITKSEFVESVLISPEGIQKAIDHYYKVSVSIEELVGILEDKREVDIDEDELVKLSEQAPIVKIVNLTILQAVKDRASDIHIEPDSEILRVRYRIDGQLHEVSRLPIRIRQAVASRIKILCSMDIAECRRAQDGKFKFKYENREFDLRVSTFPTIHGENIVMRLLDRTSSIKRLDELGFFEDDLSAYKKVLKAMNGIIFVTGPTGSGKTTTLYSTLSEINSMGKNIITIEDPVEYELPLIRQTQVNHKADITFANGLRNILRQDPDIILVGEIRDEETAEVAIQAALTGHLVFSTLHTNDAASSIVRLFDMGAEPYLVSSATLAILAQRLVGRVCEKCKEVYSPSIEILNEFKLNATQEFYHGKGCKDCKNTGFDGRLAVYELMVINDDLRQMISNNSTDLEIKNKAIDLGMRTLRENGLLLAKKGLTTLEEVIRVSK